MARRGRTDPQPAPRPPVVAAARRIPLNSQKMLGQWVRKANDWQQEAWAYYDEIGLIKQAINLAANSCSKVRLFAGVRPVDDPDAEPVPITDEASGIPADVAAVCVDQLAMLRSQIGGQTAIIRRWVQNIDVPGECWLVQKAERPPVGEVEATPGEVLIASIDEIVYRNKRVYFADEQGRPVGDPLDEAAGDDIVRMWDPHPRRSEKADSAMRGVLGDCRALQLLSQAVIAESMSRLPAGLLKWPNGLTVVGGATDEDGVPLSFAEQLDMLLTSPIDDPSSPTSVSPVVVTGEKEELAELDLVRLGRESDSTLDERIAARDMAIARGLNLPVESVTGLMATTFCADDQTEVLTANGWRRHDQIEAGTVVLTLDHETGLAEWQPTRDVYRFEVEDEPMLLIDRKSHSSFTTGGHRWPVVLAGTGKRTWRTSHGGVRSKLNTASRLTTAAPVLGLPSEAKWSDELVELVAWFYTEGHADRRGGTQGVITQSDRANPGHVARIRACLTRLMGPALGSLKAMGDRWAWREYHDPNTPNVRFHLSAALVDAIETLAPDRAPTAEFVRSLTASQLELFLTVSVLADGWVVNTGTVMFSQNDPRRVDGYELAIILSGRTPSRWSRNLEGTGTLRGRFFTQHYCSMSERTTVQPVTLEAMSTDPSHDGNGRMEWVRHTGTVWCPATENGTWMARRNGSVYFTGNSNAKTVDKQKFDDHYQPRIESFCDAVTVGWYRPALAKPGRDGRAPVALDLLERIVVWYDPSDVIGQPDQEANADAAHALLTISDEAYRRAKGFNEEDAPDPEEVLTRVGLRGVVAAQVTVALLQALADEAGVTLPDPSTLTAPAGGPSTMAALAAGLWGADRSAPVPARAITAVTTSAPDYGGQLVAIDRELRTRMTVAASEAMGRALEKAGNRMRTKNNAYRTQLRGVDAYHVGHVLGRQVVTAAGVGDALDGAWGELEGQFMAWGAVAQSEAVDVASVVASGFTDAQRARLGMRQAQDLSEAWGWLRGALDALAGERLFDPDPAAPALGEHDPSLRVPTGMLREAVARAGGATGLTVVDGAVLVDAGTRPAGGVGTGELLRDAMRDAGVGVEGYRWDYGPALRTPFEAHRRLSGKTFINFDDEILRNPNPSFPPFRWLLPGDHEFCCCDCAPVLIPPVG